MAAPLRASSGTCSTTLLRARSEITCDFFRSFGKLFYQGFDFSIVLSDDSQYGVEEEPGNWTGLIGMVQREVISNNLIFPV